MVLRPLDPSDIGDCDLVVALATHAALRWRRATRWRLSLAPTDLLANIRSACSYLFVIERDDEVFGLAALSDLDPAARVATLELVAGPHPEAASELRIHAADAVRLVFGSMSLRRLYSEHLAGDPFPLADDLERWERELVIESFAVVDGVPTAQETWVTTPERWAT
jgi:hypothetical protein